MNCVTSLIVSVMSNFMPTLPYAPDALEPVISKETIDFHYGKHLQTYANNLEKLTRGTALENRSIEEIVVDAPEGAVYNNAGQVMNHQLYFQQFTPNPRTDKPEGKLATLIVREFGSFEEMQKKMVAFVKENKDEFVQAAMDNSIQKQSSELANSRKKLKENVWRNSEDKKLYA